MPDAIRRTYRLFLLLSIGFSPSLAHAEAGLSVEKMNDATARAVQTVNLQVPNAKRVTAIRYGNGSYGMFRSTRFERIGATNIRWQYLPPGYKKPISVQIEMGQTLRKGPTLHPRSPFPAEWAWSDLVKIRGTFSSPYFLLDAQFRRPPNVFAPAMIFNREGEVVWVWAPPLPASDEMTPSLNATVARLNGDSTVTVLHGFRNSQLTQVHLLEGPKWTFDARHSAVPFGMNHDWYLENDDTFLTFGSSYRDLPPPLFSLSVVLRFVGSTLVRVWRKSGRTEVLWDYLADIDPRLEPDHIDHTTFAWANWDRLPGQRDFFHANTLQRFPDGGSLILSRNLQKIFRLSADAKILWTVGISGKNDFSIEDPKARWTQPHHATILEDGSLLIFDNGTEANRILQFALDKTGGKAKLIRQYTPEPPLFARRCGSAYREANGNIVGFFPRNLEQEQLAVLLEFDGKTGAELARFTMGAADTSFRCRAQPLPTLLGETALPRKGLIP